jgi:hypothetical protein
VLLVVLIEWVGVFVFVSAFSNVRHVGHQHADEVIGYLVLMLMFCSENSFVAPRINLENQVMDVRMLLEP